MIIIVKINGMRVKALFDTGAAMTILRRDTAHRIKAIVGISRQRAHSVNGESLPVEGEIDIEVEIGSKTIQVTGIVMRRTLYVMVIGGDLIRESGPYYLDLGRCFLYMPRDYCRDQFDKMNDRQGTFNPVSAAIWFTTNSAAP
jgi:gag-polyprotein putative aspartyl protease